MRIIFTKHGIYFTSSECLLNKVDILDVKIAAFSKFEVTGKSL